MWQLFPNTLQKEQGEREGSGDVMGSGCGGSGSHVAVWEGPSGKNRLNSTSPELGDTGARGGPCWVVPAAAVCACCEGPGGGVDWKGQLGLPESLA